MKKLIYLCLLGLLVAGCSRSGDTSQAEQLGKNISDQMKAPIEKARIASEKASATRDVELPK